MQQLSTMNHSSAGNELKLWPARDAVGNHSSHELLSAMTMSCPEDSISQHLSPASSSDIPAAITAMMSLEPCMAEVYTDEPSTAEHSQLLIIDPCTRFESLNYYHPLQMKLLWPRVRTLICGYKQKCFESSLTAFSMTETDDPPQSLWPPQSWVWSCLLYQMWIFF